EKKYDELINKYNEEYNSTIKSLTKNDIGLYLISKHAIERNITFHKKYEDVDLVIDENGNVTISGDPKLTLSEDDLKKINYSGVNLYDAIQNVKSFEEGVDQQDLNELWEAIKAITDKIDNLKVNYGYLTNETISRAYDWKYYVPLRYKQFDLSGASSIANTVESSPFID
ncbi:MAG: hypothetical protein ACP5Q5_11430, partial [Brevinematia bacterium]